MRILAALTVCILAGLLPVRAADRAEADATVWAGVFLGSAAPGTAGEAPASDNAKAVVERMAKVAATRFAHYRLLGEHTQPLLKEYQSWLVPSRRFFFNLDSRGPDPGGGIRMAVQLWREQEVVLKTDVVLKGDRAVLVRGPATGDGVLIVALRLARKGG